MAGTNIKLFDENKGNIMGDGEYAGNAQRLNGVQSGVASSALNNKFAYQVSLVCYAIAQMMNANGLDANDTLAVSAFVSNLSNSVLQKVIDKADTATAQAGTDNTKWMTPLTVRQNILSWWSSTSVGVNQLPTIPVTKGGTSKTSWVANRLIYPNTTTAFAQLANPSVNSVLCQNPSGAPFFMPNMFQQTLLWNGSFSGVNTNNTTIVPIVAGKNLTNCIGLYIILNFVNSNIINLDSDTSYLYVAQTTTYLSNNNCIAFYAPGNSNVTFSKAFKFFYPLCNILFSPNTSAVFNFAPFQPGQRANCLSIDTNVNFQSVSGILLRAAEQYNYFRTSSLNGNYSVYGLFTNL